MDYFNNTRWKQVSVIPGFEEFEDYIVDVNGSVWSTKGGKYIKKLKPSWAKEKGRYFTVTLYNKRKPKKVYVHRLVSMAFIKSDDISKPVMHKNGVENNIENLEWYIPGNKEKISPPNELLKKCNMVREATIRKGLNLPNEHDFIEQLLLVGLEEHIQRYGLRKLLHVNGVQ
jgi:hypothetical protein